MLVVSVTALHLFYMILIIIGFVQQNIIQKTGSVKLYKTKVVGILMFIKTTNRVFLYYFGSN